MEVARHTGFKGLGEYKKGVSDIYKEYHDVDVEKEGMFEAMGDERFVVVKGEWKGRTGEVFLACIYGPHVSRHKASLWDRLSGLRDRCNGAWCIFGDLNVVRRNEDRLNSQVNVGEMRDFNDFIKEARLVEIPIRGCKFTRISDDGMKKLKKKAM
ncbi:RNA-directed DNA polymerase, eukaryota [Tanacetum coccineum]